MANDLNQCNFIGRLGRDPELRYLPSGDAVASFSIAVGQSWKDKTTGEKKEKTEWVNMSAFGKLAEVIGEYLKKGSKVFVTGQFETRKYEKNGEDRYATQIRVSSLQMLDSKPQGEGDSAPRQQGSASRQPASRQPNFSDMDDDIPF